MKTLRFVLVAAIAVLTAVPAASQNKKNAREAAAEAATAFANTPTPEVVPPKPKYWNKNATTNFTFNQLKLNNWAAGGVNNVTLAASFNGNANYAKGKTFFNNNLLCNYGFIYQADKPFIQKNADLLRVISQYGHRKSDKLNITTQFILTTQFTNTYNYNYPANIAGDSPTAKEWRKARTIRSGLFSPATITLGSGVDWIPNPKNRWIVFNFQPVTGSVTLVSSEELRRQYGLARYKKYKDETQFPYTETLPDGTVKNHGEYYKFSRFELGAQYKMDLNVKVNTTFTYSSTLILFSNYLHNPLNMRVDLTNRINWTLAKHLAMSFQHFLKYDDLVRIKNPNDIDKYPDGKRRIQLQEIMGLTFTYSFPVPKK